MNITRKTLLWHLWSGKPPLLEGSKKVSFIEVLLAIFSLFRVTAQGVAVTWVLRVNEGIFKNDVIRRNMSKWITGNSLTHFLSTIHRLVEVCIYNKEMSWFRNTITNLCNAVSAPVAGNTWCTLRTFTECTWYCYFIIWESKAKVGIRTAAEKHCGRAGKSRLHRHWRHQTLVSRGEYPNNR